MALQPGFVVRPPQREARPDRQSHAIVWRVERDTALVVPIITITGRPAEGVPERHAAHRSEILLEVAEIRAMGLPLRRAIVSVDKMRRMPVAALVHVSEVGTELMRRINQAVEREIAAQKAEAIRLVDAIGSSFRLIQGVANRQVDVAFGAAKSKAAQ